MSDNSKVLIGVIEKNNRMLERIYSSLHELYNNELQEIGKTDKSSLMVAGLLENYYTCAETTFLRISQYFENSLDSDHWHRDLLEKMTIEIEGIRIPAVTESIYPKLLELLKFRHFKRYYFELEYDWDRLEYIKKKLEEAHPVLISDLGNFIEFLRQI